MTEISKKTFRKPSDNNHMDFGKIPPQVKELEEAVLGAVMMDSVAMNDIEAQFFPEMFYVDAHQRICMAIVMLHKAKAPIDILTVSEQLSKNGELEDAGGSFFLGQLTTKVASAANVSYHCKVIFEKWISRRLISWSTGIIREAYADTTDIFDFYARVEKEWKEIGNTIFTGQIEDLGTQVDEAAKLIERQMEGKGAGVPSKHSAINRHLGGWQKQTLNIVGARPGMGKTALLVSEVWYAIKNKHKVAVFSIEPTKKQFFARLLTNISGVPWNRAKNKNFRPGEEQKWYDAIYELKQYSQYLTVDFTPGITIEDLVSKCAKIKADKALDAVWIDYIQLMRVENPKGMNRDSQLGEISRGVKTMSKSLDIAVIALAALNRKSEEKADKQPGLIDLRESGNIESDADTVSFLMRPEYWFKKDAHGDVIYEGDQADFRDICQLFNEKNREDKTFKEDLKCNLGTSNFIDIEGTEEIAFSSAPEFQSSSRTVSEDDLQF